LEKPRFCLSLCALCPLWLQSTFRFRRAAGAAVLLGALLAAVCGFAPVRAMIERLYSIKEVISASKVVAEGGIESINAEEQVVVIAVKNTIKGKCTFEKIKILANTGQVWHPKALLRNLKTGEPALVFYDVDGNILPGLVYSCGLWFQIYGDLEKKEAWSFVHVELLMNRAYAGPAAEFIAIVKDAVAGKREPPAPDPKRPPVTREDLLGKEACAAPAAAPARAGTVDQLDGYEDCQDWQVEYWGQPAEASCPEMEGRGKVLLVSYGGKPHEKYIPEAARGDGEHHDKVAVTRVLEADFSQAGRLLFEAANQSAKAIKLSWAIYTMDWQYFESPCVELAAGQRRLNLQIDLAAQNFKCAASQWKPTSALLNRQRVSKLCLVIEGPPEKGNLLIDRVRLDYGSPFVRSLPLPGAGKARTGVSWVDYEGNGNYGAFVCCADGDGNRLYKNNGADFKDVTEEAGLKGFSQGAAWADYDGDGALDLALAKPLRLFHNEGGRFRDVTKTLPPIAEGNARGVAWVDVNGDGRPDLLFPSGEQGLAVFLNLPCQKVNEAQFVDASKQWGLGSQGLGLGAGDWLAPSDYDGDGFTDFLYNHGRTLLAHNEEGKAFRQAAKCGIVFAAEQALGVAWGDYDNDGALDVFVPQSGKCCLFHNNKDGTFTNVIDQVGALAKMPRNARSAAWGDVNRDGFLDLVVGFSDGPALLFLSDGKGKFLPGIPLDAFKCAWNATGMAFGDFDHDGNLDLLIAGEEGAGVLVNGCPPAAPERVPLTVRLPRSAAPGALIRLYTKEDKPLGVRQAGLVSNFNSQEPPETLFYVPPGEYKVNVLFTNGQARHRALWVEEKGLVWEVPRP